jgi:hypothetical protein
MTGFFAAARFSAHGICNMEVNQLKRQLKDLAERTASLRGFL